MEWFVGFLPIIGSVGFLASTFVRRGRLTGVARGSLRSEATGVQRNESVESAGYGQRHLDVERELRAQRSVYLDLRERFTRLSNETEAALASLETRVERCEKSAGQLEDEHRYVKAELAELFMQTSMFERVLSKNGPKEISSRKSFGSAQDFASDDLAS